MLAPAPDSTVGPRAIGVAPEPRRPAARAHGAGERFHPAGRRRRGVAGADAGASPPAERAAGGGRDAAPRPRSAGHRRALRAHPGRPHPLPAPADRRRGRDVPPLRGFSVRPRPTLRRLARSHRASPGRRHLPRRRARRQTGGGQDLGLLGARARGHGARWRQAARPPGAPLVETRQRRAGDQHAHGGRADAARVPRRANPGACRTRSTPRASGSGRPRALRARRSRRSSWAGSFPRRSWRRCSRPGRRRSRRAKSKRGCGWSAAGRSRSRCARRRRGWDSRVRSNSWATAIGSRRCWPTPTSACSLRASRGCRTRCWSSWPVDSPRWPAA